MQAGNGKRDLCTSYVFQLSFSSYSYSIHLSNHIRYDRNKLAAPHNMDFTKVTRVNFAFFQTNTKGDIWGTDSWADPNLLFGPYDWNPNLNSTEYCSWDNPTTKNCKAHKYEEGLIYQAHAAGAEIYPSLGGWSLSHPFPAMSANTQTRATFVQKCIELIVDYNFDGIDLDWEYPGKSAFICDVRHESM